MKVLSFFLSLLVLTPLWSQSAAALAGPKLQAKTNKPSPPIRPVTTNVAPQMASSHSFMSPKTALRIISVSMLVFGISGVLTPNFHYRELAGVALEEPLSDPVRVYMVLFAVRETIMAFWIILATKYLSNAVCRIMAYTISIGLVPLQIYTFIAKKNMYRPGGCRMLVTLLAFVGVYLGLAALFGA
jgi:hypothetical protein